MSFQLNRSDSDSAMSLHKRLAFQRSMFLERRSLRVPMASTGGSRPAKSPSKSPSSSPCSSRSSTTGGTTGPMQTPLDLELDLAAQQAKLGVLQEEIDRLRAFKARMEEWKEKGRRDLPPALHEQFQQMLSALKTEVDEAAAATTNTREDRRVEKMLRRTGREIYRLRKSKTASKGQPDVHAFRWDLPSPYSLTIH